MTIPLDLHQVVYALSDALDLVGVDDVYHGKRVALMATECGRHLGLDDACLTTLFNAGLLHDCGVSSTRVHHQLVTKMDWKDTQPHCDRGYTLLKTFTPLAHLAPYILYHHTHWETLIHMGLPEHVATLSNLLFLADRTDMLATAHYERDLLMSVPAVQHSIAKFSGKFFAPSLVDTFLAASRKEAFWLTLEPPHIHQYLAQMAQRESIVPIDTHQLKQLATIFSSIVDAKSSFTTEHSLGVSRLAKLLGNLADLPQDTCDQLEIAGLMHDLGKLQVCDDILEKPAPLNPAERAAITRHSFETYQILRRIPGLEKIAQWAAFHHETLNGEGYPYRHNANQLTVEARIIAIADIFQALAQKRPYRAPLPPHSILEELQRLAARQRLDTSLIALVAANLTPCWQAATQPAFV